VAQCYEANSKLYLSLNNKYYSILQKNRKTIEQTNVVLYFTLFYIILYTILLFNLLEFGGKWTSPYKSHIILR